MSTINREDAIAIVRNRCKRYTTACVAAVTEIEQLPDAQEEKWVSEIREAYDRAVKNPYIRKPLSRALYEVWHRYDQTEVERR